MNKSFIVELLEILENVKYTECVEGLIPLSFQKEFICEYVMSKKSRLLKLRNYIIENPSANVSDIFDYVSEDIGKEID